MILYVTKETFERYKLKMPDEMENVIPRMVSQAVIEREAGDKLLEWGGKLFYFDKRKCLQVVNFASKLTFVLVDVKVGDLENVGNMIANYLFMLYENNKAITNILEKHFEKYPAVCFSKLKDKSVIATLNWTQLTYLDDGYRLWDYARDGILHTVELNKNINRDWLFTQKTNGKTEYFYAADMFEKLMIERYGK